MKSFLCCAALTILVSPLFAQKDNSPKATYLALGDSLAFGYNPNVQPPNLAKYFGYPDIDAIVVAQPLANASCPGETSSTFIGASTVFYPGFNCITMQQQNQLFVPYNGAADQLAYAVSFLQANPGTKLVTIDIGVNDLGILLINCQTQYAGNSQGAVACEESGLPGTLATIGQNLTTIFTALRATGYKNPIIAVNAFSFNYNDPVETGAITAFNQLTAQVASQFNVTVADIFPVFQRATANFGGEPCTAGLLIKYPNGTCDTHPNLLGQGLVAATVAFAVEGGALK